jgi:hypothetical protein
VRPPGGQRQGLDAEAVLALRLKREHVLAVAPAADLATILDVQGGIGGHLARKVAGRIEATGAQTAEGHERGCHSLGDRLLALGRRQPAKDDGGVLPDAGQEIKKFGGSRRSGTRAGARYKNWWPPAGGSSQQPDVRS